MISLEGYTVRKCAQETARSELYVATRDSDGLEVWIRRHRADSDDKQFARTRTEHEALLKGAGPGVVEVLQLELGSIPALLVLERVPGLPLDAQLASRRFAPAELLEIAVQLAAALERMHGARWIHRDVQPCKVMFEPRTRRAVFVDLGLAQPYGAGGAEVAPHGESWPGNLHYAAPEQTGRMNRGVDFRSDLYSLGALLYHALTGRPPFEGEDALELIHAHMTRLPPPPIECCADIPPTLSRIVMKLLQKEPEDRYQTARAVHRDLAESLQQLQRTGRIDDDLRLATADAPFRPLFAKRLYGREREIEALHAAYARAAAGSPQLLLLSGAPGIGKSALVHELRGALAQTGGYLALGKFDLYRRTLPYAGFSGAFQSLVQQMLVESEGSLLAWREQLLGALCGLGGALLGMVPELPRILGQMPELAELGPGETRARLGLAVERFVRGVATPQHPLVLVLDDLQWADAGSWYLLEDLLLQGEAPALLLVGAYRDGEVGGAHPLPEMLARLEQRGVPRETLEIGPLAPHAVAEMLADALGRPQADVQQLAQQVAQKTGSTPLMIQQFVLHLYEVGALRFVDGQGWCWDDAGIGSASIPAGPVGLLAAKLERLEAKPRSLIQFASCVGDEFDRTAISSLMGEPVAVLESALFTLAEQGILAPSAAGFRFVHDRVREAAQALLQPHERAALHRRAGLLLLERTPREQRGERSFEIADHLNRARELLQGSEREAALEANLAAGERALAAGAAATAGLYFEAALAQLAPGDWERDRDTALALHVGAAEAAYQTNAFPRALELLDRIDARALTPVQQGRSWAKRLRILNLMNPDAGSDSEAAELTLALLRRLGVRWPRRPTRLQMTWEILRCDWLLRGPLEELYPNNDPGDESWLAPILVFEAGATALTRDAPGLILYAAHHSIREQRRHAPIFGAGYALAGYAAFRIAATLNPAGMERLADAALDWMQRAPHPLDLRGELCLHALVYPWLRPRTKVCEALQRLGDRAREAGDFEFGVYAEHWRVLCSLLAGRALASVVRDIEQAAHRNAMHGMAYFWDAYLCMLGLLCGPSADPGAWQPVFEAAQRQLAGSKEPSIHVFWTCWIGVLCTLGQYAPACALAERISRDIHREGTPGSAVVDYTFVRGLAAAVQAGTAGGGSKRRRHARVLHRCETRLRFWARHSVDFLHMALFLQAERARLKGDVRRALSLYAQGARRAREQDYCHHAALLHERRAELLLEERRAREAVSAFEEARELYAGWGAEARANELGRRIAEQPWGGEGKSQGSSRAS